MIKRKLKVRSRQIFEENIEEVNEEHECLFESVENKIKIVYDKIVINVEKNNAIIENDNSKLFIQNGKKDKAIYNTPYGKIELEIDGKEIEIIDDIQVKIIYLIKIGNAKEYINELYLSVFE